MQSSMAGVEEGRLNQVHGSAGGCFARAQASVILFLLLGCLAAGAWAHSTGENYVWVNVAEGHIEGRFAVRLDDLRQKLGLDLPHDYDEALAAVVAQSKPVRDYLSRNFTITVNGEVVPLQFTETDLFRANALGHFAQYHYRSADLEVPLQLEIQNTLFFEDDPFHRSLLLVEFNEKVGKKYGSEFTALVFSPYNSDQVLDFANIQGLLSKTQFVWQGIKHIWIGIDHILFLVALLLPAVLIRRDHAWIPVDSFTKAFWNIAKIVTVFTIAHSITLALAALNIVQLPSRLVESVIALSIILVALNNIFPKFQHRTLLIVFGFGLFHGLGFASVMGDLPFRMENLVWVLVAFNVGVEIGQLVIVSAIVPLIFWMRNTAFYRTAVPAYGSAALAVVAGYWFVERALGLG